MGAKFDRQAASLLHALLRVAVMSLTSGVHHLPPEVADSKDARLALQALSAAFEKLRADEAEADDRELSENFLAVFETLCALRDALDPLRRAGFGPLDLYSRAAVARSATVEARGAPISGADNLVRLPINPGHALAGDELRRNADLAFRHGIGLEAQKLERALGWIADDELDFVTSAYFKASSLGTAVRRAQDACYEIEKLCAERGDAKEKTAVLAELWEARLALAENGLGDDELEEVFERALTERAKRERVCPPGPTVRLARVLASGWLRVTAVPGKRRRARDRAKPKGER